MPQIHQEEMRETQSEVTPVLSSRAAVIRHEFADVVSAVVHPLLFPLLTIAAVNFRFTHDLVKAFMIVLMTVVIGTVPVALLVLVQVKRGAWSDFDVSQRRQRYTLYPFTLLCLALLMYVYYLQGAFYAVQCTLTLVIANVINSFVNLAWKISAHATTAAACATLLWHFTPAWGPAATVGAALVGWSRVELCRHTRGQVLAGWLVGISSALLATARP
jgi:membrane-associated phospholipid phosphatase